MNQLLGQQDTPCLGDRHRGRTEMLSKQAAELSLSDAQAFGQAIDTSFVECASVDQRQRPRHRVRRPAPGGKLGRRFWPTSQAGTKARFLRRRCRRIKRHVLTLGHARGTDRTAIDPRCPDSGEQPPVEARVASAERAITRVNVEVHDLSLPPVVRLSGGFRTSSRPCTAEAAPQGTACHNRRRGGPRPAMTARADRLTKRAKTPDRAGFVRSSYPASSARVFVDALERLNYRMEPLLATAGIRRADLHDPDARIPCTVWGPMFRRALEQRSLKNAGMRLATVTPLGAFPLIDYLIATSQNVGEGLTRLARYLPVVEARSVPRLREEEDPIRVLLDGCETTLSTEFTVTINLLHFREETEGRFRAAYASFCHQPDDVAEIEGVLGCPVYTRAAWNGWALSRETYQLPLRRRDPALGGLLQRQADEAIARLPSIEGVALEVRRALTARVGGGDTRLQTIARALATSPRSLQRRLAAAGVSYQQLLDLARRDAAERYLIDSPLSIGEVAYLLGYSEPAAFNRAFKRWRRETPQAFRLATARRRGRSC